MQMLRSIIEALFWLIIALLLITLTMLLFGWGTTPTVSYAVVLAVVALFPLVLRMITMIRRRRGAAVLTYVEQAVRLNMPLARMLDAARASEGGGLSERLAELSMRLKHGHGLARAIEISVPEVPATAVATLAAAERVGRVPQALHRLTHEQSTKFTADTTDAAFYRAYPLLMIVLITG